MPVMRFRKVIEFDAQVVRPDDPEDEGQELQVSEGQRLYGLYAFDREIFLSSNPQALPPAMLLVLPNTEPAEIPLAGIPTHVTSIVEVSGNLGNLGDVLPPSDDNDDDTCPDCGEPREDCTCSDEDNNEDSDEDDNEDSDEDDPEPCPHCNRVERDCTCRRCDNCGFKAVECACLDAEDEDHEPDADGEERAEEPAEPEEVRDEQPPLVNPVATIMEAELPPVDKPTSPNAPPTGTICQGCNHPVNECICT